MTQAVREIMRGKGYLPHNGHGFVRVSKAEMAADPVVTRSYAFKYHQHVYGADEDEYIGLGNSALSYIAGSTITNELSRERYVNAMLGKEALPVGVVDHPAHVNAAKILAIGLPYLGSAPAARVRWEELPEGMAARIADLVDHGLVEHDANELRLTHDGWLWYVNLMFYLVPREEQASIAGMVMRDAAGAYLPARTVEQLTAIA